jgi:hypothetical protein
LRASAVAFGSPDSSPIDPTLSSVLKALHA